MKKQSKKKFEDIKCEICHVSFGDKKAFNKHLKNCECDECGGTQHSKHQRLCPTLYPKSTAFDIKCFICQNTYDNSEEFDAHIDECKCNRCHGDQITGHNIACKFVAARPSIAEQTKDKDAVNNPSHYGGLYNQYEVIKVLKAWGMLKSFTLGNVIKYIARSDKKGATLEDLKKARWYLDYEIQLREGHASCTIEDEEVEDKDE